MKTCGADCNHTSDITGMAPPFLFHSWSSPIMVNKWAKFAKKPVFISISEK